MRRLLSHHHPMRVCLDSYLVKDTLALIKAIRNYTTSRTHMGHFHSSAYLQPTRQIEMSTANTPNQKINDLQIVIMTIPNAIIQILVHQSWIRFFRVSCLVAMTTDFRINGNIKFRSLAGLDTETLAFYLILLLNVLVERFAHPSLASYHYQYQKVLVP